MGQFHNSNTWSACWRSMSGCGSRASRTSCSSRSGSRGLRTVRLSQIQFKWLFFLVHIQVAVRGLVGGVCCGFFRVTKLYGMGDALSQLRGFWIRFTLQKLGWDFVLLFSFFPIKIVVKLFMHVLLK